VHGISNTFLDDKPKFAEIVEGFLAFVQGAELVIHNAPFDVGFLDAEFARLGATFGKISDHCPVLDTLALARKLRPGQKNNLDALCRFYEVDNSHRDLHGALLDAEILAEVYLRMTGGQGALALGGQTAGGRNVGAGLKRLSENRAPLPVLLATEEELAAHEAVLAQLDKASGNKTLWRN
jgi:DNA polymerase-3 subunit epsilon